MIKQLTVEFALMEDVTSFASASKLFIAYIVTLETDWFFSNEFILLLIISSNMLYPSYLCVMR